MKQGTIFCILCLICGLFAGIFIADIKNSISTNGINSLCITQKYFAMNSLQEFLQNNIPKQYTLTITDTTRIFELSKSPSRLGSNLYDEIKNGAICKSELEAVITNNETQQEFTTKINTRYQLSKALIPEDYIYINISGIDLEEASDELMKEIRSHIQ